MVLRSIVTSGALFLSQVAMPDFAATQIPERAQVVERSTSGTAILSPTVAATWYALEAGAEPPELIFTVLWRGDPGWYRIPGRHLALGLGGGSEISPEGEVTARTVELMVRFGEESYDVEFDHIGGTVRFLDREIEMGADNVLLVDEVARAGVLPTVVGTARVDARLPDLLRFDPAEVLGRSEGVREFLRQ
jgi:hypothetical protein